jgi:superkiller protein 3
MSAKFWIFWSMLMAFSVASYPQEGLNFYNQGIELANAERYSEAIQAFSKGIEASDISIAANYLGRARCYFELGEFEPAKKDVESGLKSEKINNERINCDLYWLNALILSIEGKEKEALEAFRKALGYSPANAALKASYSLALIESGQPEKAVELLDQVLAQSQDDAYALNNRALGLIYLTRIEESKRDLDKSFEIDSENPFLYKNYFLYFQAIGDMDKACRNLKMALSKDMAVYGYPKDSAELKELWETRCGEAEDK